MYNLQTVKEEIDQVAKHTTALTEYVMSLSEGVITHDKHDAKLADFKSEILKAIETKFADLERKIFGENAPEHTSAVADLGHTMSKLLPSASTAPPTTESSGDHHEHYQDDHHQHDHDHHQQGHHD